MVARVLTIEGLDPAKREETERLVRERAVQRLRAQNGFVAYVALAMEGERGMAVILWETREDAEAAEQALAERRNETAAEAGFRVVANELYEAPIVEFAG